MCAGQWHWAVPCVQHKVLCTASQSVSCLCQVLSVLILASLLHMNISLVAGAARQCLLHLNSVSYSRKSVLVRKGSCMLADLYEHKVDNVQACLAPLVLPLSLHSSNGRQKCFSNSTCGDCKLPLHVLSMKSQVAKAALCHC